MLILLKIGSSKIGGTADPLGSQDSLQVAGDYLYAVNASGFTLFFYSIPYYILLLGWI